ncbi:hypothetical protein ACGC1H_002436 [Rhizoctonia solani]
MAPSSRASTPITSSNRQNPHATWDRDLVLKSVDGQEFKAHSLVLALSSPVFADMFEVGTRTPGQIIQLAETGEMVDLMLKFIYPRQSTMISSFETLDEALHAANKYQLDDMYQQLRQQLLSRDSSVSMYTDPLKALDIASTHRFKKETLAASALAHGNYDFTTVDGLLQLAQSAPESIPWIIIIGIPSVKSKVIADVLFNYSEYPMTPPRQTCELCREGRADSTRYSPPEWQARWAHAVSAELLKRPIQDCKSLFDLPFLCQTAFHHGSEPIRVGRGTCNCLVKLSRKPSCYYIDANGVVEEYEGSQGVGELVTPSEPDCFSHWSYQVYDVLETRLKRLEELENLITE